MPEDEKSQKEDNRKKITVSIVITVLVVLFYAVYFGFIIAAVGRVWAILLGIIPLALGGTMIYLCVQRIREIKGGEEDDLGKY